MDRVRLFLSITVWCGACVAGMARADIYVFRDADGVTHFSNVPADPRYAVMIHEPRPGADRPAGGPTRAGRHEPYGILVAQAAQEHNLDQALLRAVISVESGHNPRAVSRKGAIGLMQLMPDTARRYGVVDPYDPAENVHAGAKYLRDLMEKFNHDLALTLAAYNAGEEAVAHFGNRIPPYRETLLYVPKVLELYRRYLPDSR